MFELDLHVHSKHSFDSLMRPKTIIKVAQRKGLRCLAVTDHNTLKGGLETYKVSRDMKSDIAVIIGSEINTNIGDITGLFINEDVKSNDALEVIESIRSQGGIAVLPHPFKGHKFRSIEHMIRIISKVDLLELFNSRAPINKEEAKFLKSRNKTLIGGSDAHFPSEIGLCKTILDANNPSIEEIRKILFLPNLVSASGSYGPVYLQTLSQIVKTIKLKEFSRLPFQSVSLIRAVLH